jgi:uncharacterized Rmd1/YagE family protein
LLKRHTSYHCNIQILASQLTRRSFRHLQNQFEKGEKKKKKKEKKKKKSLNFCYSFLDCQLYQSHPLLNQLCENHSESETDEMATKIMQLLFSIPSTNCTPKLVSSIVYLVFRVLCYRSMFLVSIEEFCPCFVFVFYVF